MAVPSHDDLSDVRLIDNFAHKFPIRHTNHIVWRNGNTDDLWQALTDTLAVYDQTSELLKGMSADQVFAKIDAYMTLAHERQRAERQAILHELARAGLSCRTILNLIPDNDAGRRRALSVMISGTPNLYTEDQAERILVADEMLMAGEPNELITATTKVMANTLRCLRRFRQPSGVGYEGALKWAFHEMMRGERTCDVYRRMLVKFPEEAALIPPHTVYALMRPKRIERNKQRFGWTDEVAA